MKKIFGETKYDIQVFEISLEKISDAFVQMEQQAQWDTSKKLYWGYYFLDHDLKKLETFAKKLSLNRFNTVEVRMVDNNMYLLHIEEQVMHTPQSLFDQCHLLAMIADEDNIEVFDGWDVEAAKMDKGLVE